MDIKNTLVMRYLRKHIYCCIKNLWAEKSGNIVETNPITAHIHTKKKNNKRYRIESIVTCLPSFHKRILIF